MCGAPCPPRQTPLPQLQGRPSPASAPPLRAWATPPVTQEVPVSVSGSVVRAAAPPCARGPPERPGRPAGGGVRPPSAEAPDGAPGEQA